MTDYPNMSYCMCENTLGAMYQVLNAMEDPDFFQDLSESERRAFQQLFNACEAFMVAADKAQDEVDLADSCYN